MKFESKTCKFAGHGKCTWIVFALIANSCCVMFGVDEVFFGGGSMRYNVFFRFWQFGGIQRLSRWATILSTSICACFSSKPSSGAEPELSARLDGTSVMFSWPCECIGYYSLEQASDVTGPWNAVAGTLGANLMTQSLASGDF